MRPTYKRPYYFIHNVNTYPSDTKWTEGRQDSGTWTSPDNTFFGKKTNFEGNFGRVPSENIYIPTDGGNTDI